MEESESFSLAILESSPDCVKVINGEGKIQFMNTNGLCAMEIDDFDNLKNKLWSSLWGEENKQTVEKALATALKGKTAQFQAFCLTAKGTAKWWDVLVSPVHVSGVEKINRIISVSRDITKQIESNKKIEESELLYRQIFNFSPVAIWEKDDEALYREIELLKTNGITNFRKYLDENPSEIIRLVSFVKLKNVNDESIHLLEAESKEEMLSDFQRLFTEESIPVLKEGIIGVAERKKRLNIHSVLKSFKGTRLEILFGFDFRVGNSINESLVTLTDVTATKNAERSLKESDERLRLATQTSGVGIWEWNVITNKVRWDAQMFRIYGVTPTADGFIAYQTWSNAVAPEDLAEQEKILQDTVKNSSTSNRSFKIYRANNHQLRYIEAIETVRTNANGQAEWVVGTNIDVTERKIADEQLIKLATHLDLSTTSAGVGVWLLDINSGKLEWSALHKSMWGFNENRTDLGYEDWHKVIHPADKEKCFAEVEAAKQEKRKYEVDYRINRANDGGQRWMKSVGQYQYNDNGQAVTLTGISIDITDAKIAEEKLIASEENFRQLSHLMPEKVSRSDAIGNVIYYNRSWLDYTGMNYEELKDWGWGKVMHPEDIEELTRLWTHSVTTGDDFDMEFRILNKEGQYRWHLCRSAAIKDEGGNIKNWVGVTIDIEQQKRFTEELELQVKNRTAELVQLNQTLNEKNESLLISENFNRSITENSPNVIYIYDIEKNKNVYLNQIGLNVIGYKLENINAIDDIQNLIVHEDDLPKVCEVMERIKNAQPGEIFEHEYRVKNTKSKWVPFLVRDTVFKRNENNVVTQIVGIAVDITEIKIAENKMLQKNSELEKINKELQTFAYISSHDLQEPLRKIQTFASRIKEKEENNLSDQGKDNFNRMQEAAKRMQTLIQDLLAYSRTNTEERKFENTDLNKIVEEAKEDLQEDIHSKHANIEANELCDANIIPFQFRQLMHNLIGNALKFSNPQHPPHIKIKSEIAEGIKLNNAKLLPEKKYCHISISDNGIGFEQQFSEKIFEVFQRLHGKNEYNGTGIGLAIVKKIVENHNGIITANGELNKGAIFDIYIPVV